MGMRTVGAKAISSLSTWGLKHIAHRPAANMPGKLALKVDPRIIAETASKLSKGSLMVVGTNGKTTVTNLLADAVERSGQTVACNRTGANLAYGVATTLLQTKGKVDWGIFESDELWLAHSLPQLQATYVLLLNLFRDQLDRYGEIDRIQNAIVKALNESPETVLIYNADDPLCAVIADRVSNKSISFGVAEDMHLPQNTVADAQMCQKCSGMFTYKYRQYGQLGNYTCSNCGFTRPALDYQALHIVFGQGVSFEVEGSSTVARAAMAQVRCAPKDADTPSNDDASRVSASLSMGQPGAYVVYNLLAAYLAAHFLGVSDACFQQAADVFDPQNGRLQSFSIEGRSVLLNLAKNPTGFNQNLKIITQAKGKKGVAFFINDNEADGHDISWIWDCDFEELAQEPDLVVYAGGIRKNDLQVRLKYAGIQARLIENVNEMVDDILAKPPDWNMYAIANYTSLPAVRSALAARSRSNYVGTDRRNESYQHADNQVLSEESMSPGQGQPDLDASGVLVGPEPFASQMKQPLRIVHLYPDLLNLYGDGGNVAILRRRCEWRGIPVEVVPVHYGDAVDLTTADLVFMGGGPDREQKLASECLQGLKDQLAAFIEGNGALLAICGGYQILGKRWLLGNEEVEGLSLIDMETLRPHAGFNRLINNIMLSSSLSALPVIGYENHAGRTYLSQGVQPFGKVVSSVGAGNNDTSHEDGVLYKRCIGSYLHGPLLSKNPKIADVLLQYALQHYAEHKQPGLEVGKLVPLNDAEEAAANAFMAQRLG